MFGVWLGSILALAAGPFHAGEVPVQVGMMKSAVDKSFDGWSYIGNGQAGTGGTGFYFMPVDWLGGYRSWVVYYDANDCVTDFKTRYHPFSNRPPWLAALRDALAPAGQ